MQAPDIIVDWFHGEDRRYICPHNDEIKPLIASKGCNGDLYPIEADVSICPECGAGKIEIKVKASNGDS